MAFPTAKIELTKIHALDREELRQRVEQLRAVFQGMMRCVTSWDKDTLRIAGSGFKGTVELGVDRVELGATLGMLLIPMRAQIEQALERELDALVAREPAAAVSP
jgi:putative polyhydroxyalkanoate system protein